MATIRCKGWGLYCTSQTRKDSTTCAKESSEAKPRFSTNCDPLGDNQGSPLHIQPSQPPQDPEAWKHG